MAAAPRGGASELRPVRARKQASRRRPAQPEPTAPRRHRLCSTGPWRRCSAPSRRSSRRPAPPGRGRASQAHQQQLRDSIRAAQRIRCAHGDRPDSPAAGCTHWPSSRPPRTATRTTSPRRCVVSGGGWVESACDGGAADDLPHAEDPTGIAPVVIAPHQRAATSTAITGSARSRTRASAPRLRQFPPRPAPACSPHP